MQPAVLREINHTLEENSRMSAGPEVSTAQQGKIYRTDQQWQMTESVDQDNKMVMPVIHVVKAGGALSMTDISNAEEKATWISQNLI